MRHWFASDPLVYDDPDRRQALWLDGVKSAAVSYNGGFQRAFSSQYDLLRQFTVECWVKPEDYTHTVNFEPCINSIFNDEMLRGIVGIDTVLSCDDDTMKMILKGISEDMSYNALAEKLYLSDSAFRYKLNKIFNLSNRQSKSKLKQVLNTLNLKDDE